MATATTKPPSKKTLITELKTVYKTLAHPFSTDEYDDACRSTCKSDVVMTVFGTWQEALRAAGLSKKFAKHHSVLQEMEVFDPEKEIKNSWKQEKNKLIERAEQKEIKWLKNQKHKVDLLKEMLDETLAKVEPLEVVVANKTKTKPKVKKENKALPHGTLWFEFSDLQLGTLITSEEMGGLNEHNWGIWQRKLEIWKDQVVEKIDFYKKVYNIDRVVIACLGDMVEGQDIFKGQQWKLDRHVVDQAMFGADDTAKAFAEILLAHSDTHFDILEVFGNHGRIGRKGEVPHACSMDKVYQRMVDLRLRGIQNLTNFTYHENEVWFYFVEIYGWNHLLLHGDQGMSKLWSGRVTINGLEKGLVRFNQMFQQQVHFLHAGHYHNDLQISFNLSQILINGSFIGTSPFSATVMTASSPPIQVMHLFEPRIGLARTERLHLGEGPIKNPVLPRSL